MMIGNYFEAQEIMFVWFSQVLHDAERRSIKVICKTNWNFVVLSDYGNFIAGKIPRKLFKFWR